MVKGAIASTSTAVPLPVVAKQRLQVDGVAFNPSVCAFDGELFVCARVMGGTGMPRAFLGRWAGDRIGEGAFLQIPEALASGLLACGGQDVRLFVLDGILHAVAAVGLGAPGPPHTDPSGCAQDRGGRHHAGVVATRRLAREELDALCGRGIACGSSIRQHHLSCSTTTTRAAAPPRGVNMELAGIPSTSCPGPPPDGSRSASADV
jgi:hypothetical protein